MVCPRCGFNGEPVQGGCIRCGYGRQSGNSGTYRLANAMSSGSSKPLIMQTVMRGDVIHQGRYRLTEQLILPDNQQDQGTAWLATDLQTNNRRVVIRSIAFPERATTQTNKAQLVRSIAERLAEVGQHLGFPALLDVFDEQGTYYIVLEHIEGESLATLLKRQGGALPERTIAKYGRQLCDLLAVLAAQQPPLIHGAVNPDTVVVSYDRRKVALIHLPLFTPQAPTTNKTSSGYLAPEQLRGTIEPASDIYGLAATLHHAVTGYDPNERLAFFHPPARRLNPAVTPEMEAILSQALRLSVQQRYANPSLMQQDFTALIASYPPVVETKPMPGTLSNTLQLDSNALRRLSQRRTMINLGLYGGISLIILLVVLFAFIRPSTLLSTPAVNVAATATVGAEQTALNKEITLETQSYQKNGVGLSDGRFVFDTFAGRPNPAEVSLKKQAAQAIQKGDLSSAVNLLNQAISADPTDGEAQIYNADVHILQSNASYVTIVLGLPIDSNPSDLVIARADMESGFLAQREVNMNKMLPGSLQLRILIDNSGSNNGNVGVAAQFVQNRVVQAGNLDHIIGVVGWPFSSQTINARDIIAAAHLPFVSQTASSVKLSGSSPYFFRVNPPDDSQGKTLGKVAVQQFGAKRILVMRDSTDPYSNSLADAFTASVKALNATAINNTADFFSEGTTTVAGYHTAIHDAIANNVDLIFLAGLDVDAVRLANALGNASRSDLANTYLQHLKILGGDAVDTGLILGQGEGPDAAIARNFPQDMQRLSFTAFGHPDEWTFEHIPQNQQPNFFAGWSSVYQSSAVTVDDAPAPGNDAILTYDAIHVIIKAATLVHGNLSGSAIRKSLDSLGKGNVPPYQGVSGRILFDAQGNPIDKAVVVLGVEAGSNGNVTTLQKVAGVFKVSG